MNTFYWIRDNQTYLPRYAWAHSILWTEHVPGPTCEICRYSFVLEPGGFDVVVDRGSKYPDILGCGRVPYFILSDRAMETWKRHGISNFDQYRVNVRVAKPKLLRGVTPPTYWRIEPHGKCAVDLRAMGRFRGQWCPKHQRYMLESSPPYVRPVQLIPGSWDGSDLFRDAFYSPYYVMCTSRLAEICITEKLLCCRFDRIGEESKPGKGDLYTK